MSTKNQLTPHGKLAVGIFVVVGLATFVFGAMKLARSAAAPFARRGTTGTFKTAEVLEQERLEKMKTDDTDKDELTDYDELYIYRTSPFLEDSDSDGFLDGVEVASNNDPNCPKGKDCVIEEPVKSEGNFLTELAPDPGDTPPAMPDFSALESIESDPVTASSTVDTTVIDKALADAFGDLSKLDSASIGQKIDQLKSQDLRMLLVKLGIPETQMKDIEDATLRDLLKQTMREAMAPASTSVEQTTSPEN